MPREEQSRANIDYSERDFAFRAYEADLRAERHRERDEGPKYVQSFITNVVAPNTLDELYEITVTNEYIPSMDVVLYMYRGDPVGWTVPRWAKIGDIVFFMHSKTSNSHLTAIRSELNRRASEFGEEEWHRLKFWVNHELDVHRMYGGRVFAIGRVAGKPYKETDGFVHKHWASTIYADIDDIQILKEPVHISEFNDFIYVSRQNAITPVFGKEYEQLMSLIASRNRVPGRFLGLKCDPMPLSRITDRNWFSIMQKHHRSFFLEQQFRTYCVDRFLRVFGDRRTFYAEGRCRKAGCADTFVDNLVMRGSRWLPVEVKLDITLVTDLESQLQQYMNVDKVVVKRGQESRMLAPESIWNDRVMVVDTEGLYLYHDDELRYLLLWDRMETENEMLETLNRTLSCICEW